MTKIRNYFIILPDKILKLNKNQNREKPTLFIASEYENLLEALEDNGYSYNRCYCDKENKTISLDEPQCGDIDNNCRAGIDRIDGYICEKVSN